jgi:hypothetical protein
MAGRSFNAGRTSVWRYVCQSVVGQRHRLDQTECQDHGSAAYFGNDSDGALVACVADGAGAAPHSRLGAQLAIQATMNQASDFVARHGTFARLRPADLAEWCAFARRSIADVAESSQQPLRDFAATLSTAVIGSSHAAFFQIGDGAIVVRRRGAMGVVFWPQSGEYANDTNFVTSPDFKRHLQIRIVSGEFSDAALLTDGIERLALQFESLTPHLPFFEPLFAGVRAASSSASLTADLKKFLESRSVAARSDDDKTLLLACRTADEFKHIA